MKKIIALTLLINVVFCIATLMSQTPEAFKYQAVVRDSAGEIVSNKNVSLRIGILKGSAAGTNVYTETHSILTNQFGLVNIEIGNGNVVSGVFEEISWQNDSYFLHLEIDVTGGSNYQLMGTSQLLSVPYSLSSKRTESVMVVDSVAQIDSITNPTIGMIVLCRNSYGSVNGRIFIWGGESWHKSGAFGCHPYPTYSNAGPDSSLFPGSNTIILQANTPVYGDGLWAIINGAGGTFSDTTNPNAEFTGVDCEYYTLKWNIATACNISTDQVNVDFDRITTAHAGEDQIFNDNTTSTLLEANDPTGGIGTWSIVQGQLGSFDDINDPNTNFTGIDCETYTLQWTISTVCDSSTDEVIIEFFSIPTVANAGQDQIFNDNTTSTLLEGNAPLNGTGTWSVVQGQGGIFDDVNNPNTIFNGIDCETYTLKWTLSTICDTSYDEVIIEFFSTPTIANAGEDQLYTDNTTSTVLQANVPANGQGTWSIRMDRVAHLMI